MTGGVVLYTVVAADRLKAHVRTFTIFITSTSQVIFCHFTVVGREMIELEMFIIDKLIVNHTSNGRNVDIKICYFVFRYCPKNSITFLLSKLMEKSQSH